jgi:hypothetical protein
MTTIFSLFIGHDNNFFHFSLAMTTIFLLFIGHDNNFFHFSLAMTTIFSLFIGHDNNFFTFHWPWQQFFHVSLAMTTIFSSKTASFSVFLMRNKTSSKPKHFKITEIHVNTHHYAHTWSAVNNVRRIFDRYKCSFDHLEGRVVPFLWTLENFPN